MDIFYDVIIPQNTDDYLLVSKYLVDNKILADMEECRTKFCLLAYLLEMHNVHTTLKKILRKRQLPKETKDWLVFESEIVNIVLTEFRGKKQISHAEMLEVIQRVISCTNDAFIQIYPHSKMSFQNSFYQKVLFDIINYCINATVRSIYQLATLDANKDFNVKLDNGIPKTTSKKTLANFILAISKRDLDCKIMLEVVPFNELLTWGDGILKNSGSSYTQSALAKYMDWVQNGILELSAASFKDIEANLNTTRSKRVSVVINRKTPLLWEGINAYFTKYITTDPVELNSFLLRPTNACIIKPQKGLMLCFVIKVLCTSKIITVRNGSWISLIKNNKKYFLQSNLSPIYNPSSLMSKSSFNVPALDLLNSNNNLTANDRLAKEFYQILDECYVNLT